MSKLIDQKCVSCHCTTSDKKCILTPYFNGQYCPCINCLVKPICTRADDECELYYKFAEDQLEEYDVHNEDDVPCRICAKKKQCNGVINSLSRRKDFEEESYEYTYKKLASQCEILETYLPRVVYDCIHIPNYYTHFKHISLIVKYIGSNS